MLEINNLTTNLFDEKIIKKSISYILNLEKCINCSISVAIVGPRKMKKLNKRYREKNRVTDVLSFAVQNSKTNEFINPANNLGEVIICPKYIKKILKREKSTFNSSILFKRFLQTLIHGVLHLLGYDHQKTGETQEMKKKEALFQKYMEKLKIYN